MRERVALELRSARFVRERRPSAAGAAGERAGVAPPVPEGTPRGARAVPERHEEKQTSMTRRRQKPNHDDNTHIERKANSTNHDQHNYDPNKANTVNTTQTSDHTNITNGKQHYEHDELCQAYPHIPNTHSNNTTSDARNGHINDIQATANPAYHDNNFRMPITSIDSTLAMTVMRMILNIIPRRVQSE